MTARGRGSGRGRGGAGERGAAKKQTTESPTMSSPARGPEIESRAEKKGRLATPYTKNRSGFLSFIFDTSADATGQRNSYCVLHCCCNVVCKINIFCNSAVV